MASLLRVTASPYVVLAGVLAVAFAFYAETIGFGFYYDDFWFLQAANSHSFQDYASAAFDYRSSEPVPQLLYRPFYVIWFYGLFKAFHLHAWAYHLLGIVGHLVNAFLLWLVVRKITRRDVVAHLAALIFVLHPTYAVAVAFVVNNIVVYSTLAYLVSLLLFLHYLDGGQRRYWHYVGAALFFIAAILIHPETSQLYALLVVATVLFSATSLRDALTPQRWLPLLPLFAVLAGFLIVQALARDADATGFQTKFSIGTHIFENYVRYTAFAVDPFRAISQQGPFFPDPRALAGRRTLAAAGLAVVAAAALLVANRRRPAASLFAIAWFLLAVLPLSTWTFGAVHRKLYAAGPPFALAASLGIVAACDYIAAETRVRIGALATIAAVAIATVFGLRVLEIADGFHVHQERYEVLVDEVARSELSVPEGSNLYVVGVPPSILTFTGAFAGIAAGIQLHFDAAHVYGVGAEEDLVSLPDPPGPNDVIYYYECPPVCQPPAGNTTQ